MVLAPCRRGPARNLLVDISRQCNTSLPDVAVRSGSVSGEKRSRWATTSAATSASRRPCT
ncbi:hypothetical protein [Streptomyces viridochromogenes]|uniref:hypothetical protein n=1 Tax=Streptomyces viridochromogenes TaxID=1938 RepID=UPI003CC7D86E